jgi:hypothetical protein
MFETFRDDPLGYIEEVKGMEALIKFEKKYQNKASRRADIRLNQILHLSRSISREWELLPITSTVYPTDTGRDKPRWYNFYHSGYKAGSVAVTNVVDKGEVATVAAYDQFWGPGGTFGTFWVPQTSIAVVRPGAEDSILPFVTADEVENTFQPVYDIKTFRDAVLR